MYSLAMEPDALFAVTEIFEAVPAASEAGRPVTVNTVAGAGGVEAVGLEEHEIMAPSRNVLTLSAGPTLE
jgi:hypothetical protein